jgi:hypothetical protein
MVWIRRIFIVLALVPWRNVVRACTQPLQIRRAATRDDESQQLKRGDSGDVVAKEYYKLSCHSLERMAVEMADASPEAAEMDLVMMV